MSSISEDIQKKLMQVLKEEENKTDLDNLAVLSRVGMRVASAYSSDLDADATSASSTALIDLGSRLSQATTHGVLTEIILHNTLGYSILQAINEEYVVFAGLNKSYRIGYYLGYLRELVKRLRRLISGDSEAEMTFSTEDSGVQRPSPQEEDEDFKPIVKPSVEQDKAALDDLLGFLDDWEQDGGGFEDLEPSTASGVVSIPKTVRTATKSAEFEDLEPSAGSGVVSIPKTNPTAIKGAEKSPFKVYDDEVPPIPLDDYTPMEIDDAVEEAPPLADEPTITTEKPSVVKDFPSPDSIPSFDELSPPDFDMGVSASEYDTEFVLEEESEALDSVLKDLGWDQEED